MSEQRVNQVVISFVGGKKNIEFLPKKSEKHVIIIPTGESNIDLTYSIDNKLFKSTIDVYFEPSYKGELFIYIDSHGQVAWDSNIKI